MQHQPAVTLHNLSFNWPSGAPALHQLDGTFARGRTGLIGDNGAGKSTLLKLIAGHLKPTAGRIETSGDVGYLPQTIALRTEDTVAHLLGIDEKIAALRAIERGEVDERHFDILGNDWDIEAQAGQSLQPLGFSEGDLDRPVTSISGGEAMLIAITGMHLRQNAITLLDEPTNNLDGPARRTLQELVDAWAGTLIVVSHDLELLEHMDNTAELYAGRLQTFGGPYSAWREHVDVEQAAAEQAARAAQQALKVEKRQRAEAETKLARRERTAKKTQQGGGIPRILAGNRASSAQASAGAMRGTLDQKVASAQAALDAADARVRADEHIHLTLPDPDVPRGRRIAEFTDATHTTVIQGPERVALVGRNGAGKTTLIQRLLEPGRTAASNPTGVVLVDHVGYLPQRLDDLKDDRNAIDNVQDAGSQLTRGEIRNQLARLLLRGDAVERPVRTLSGGERFRVQLARLLFMTPPAQLLVLDEPTNNLDIKSVEQLAEALEAYRGAMLVVSHDHHFLQRLGIDHVLELPGDGTITRRDSLPNSD